MLKWLLLLILFLSPMLASHYFRSPFNVTNATLEAPTVPRDAVGAPAAVPESPALDTLGTAASTAIAAGAGAALGSYLATDKTPASANSPQQHNPHTPPHRDHTPPHRDHTPQQSPHRDHNLQQSPHRDHNSQKNCNLKANKDFNSMKNVTPVRKSPLGITNKRKKWK